MYYKAIKKEQKVLGLSIFNNYGYEQYIFRWQ